MKTLQTSLKILLLASAALCCRAESFQAPASIQSAISKYIKNKLTQSEIQDFKVHIDPLDPRLKLRQCDIPLNVFSRDPQLKFGRNSFGVRCSGQVQWTIYSQVNIQVFQSVVVSKQTIRRGTLITADMLTQQKLDVSNLRQGIVYDPAKIIGKQANRNVFRGHVLNLTHFEEPTLVKRGEKVHIQLKSPYLTISAQGIALSDGHQGQRIQVRNVKTQKIVQATVTQSGLVNVWF